MEGVGVNVIAEKGAGNLSYRIDYGLRQPMGTTHTPSCGRR
jgi:hypothetical protein